MAVDWLVTGDFDAKGRVDIAVASRDRDSMTWWPLIGEFEIGSAVEVSLGGRPTAMISGEIHRRDGLIDLAVSVEGEKTAALLIFQSPRGALEGAIERRL